MEEKNVTENVVHLHTNLFQFAFLLRCQTYACSWLCRCCTSSFLLSTIPTNSASKSASRSRCACDFRQSSTDRAARNSLLSRAYFVSKSFSCSLRMRKEKWQTEPKKKEKRNKSNNLNNIRLVEIEHVKCLLTKCSIAFDVSIKRFSY